MNAPDGHTHVEVSGLCTALATVIVARHADGVPVPAELLDTIEDLAQDVLQALVLVAGCTDTLRHELHALADRYSDDA